VKTKYTMRFKQDLKLRTVSDRITDDGMYIILPCVHAPFHNEKLTFALLRVIQDIKDKVSGIVILGDFVDLHSLSSHDRGKVRLKNITLSEEYRGANRLLDRLQAVLPNNIHKVYIEGNHENRTDRYLSQVDNNKLGTDTICWKKALRLQSRRYLVLDNWKEAELQLGDLTLMHGEFCNIHTAKKHLEVYKKSMMFCHTHRMQTYHEGHLGSYNIGTMCDMNSPVFNYATKSMKNTWANGFALVSLHKGKHTAELVKWRGDHLIYSGKVYK
jgi:predicted phosphodiesterase